MRILDPNGTPVGGGVLVAGGRVATCAHVVHAALRSGIAEGAEDLRDAELTVDFPGSDALDGDLVRAGIAPRGWAPPDGERADVAVLELRRPAPGDCRPAVLRPCGPAGDRLVRAFGQVTDAPAGMWVRARLLGPGGLSPDWVQLEAAGTAGDRIRRGYSGAGVIDGCGDVIGLVVAEDTLAQRRTAWMIPVEAAVRYCPILADAVTGHEGPSGQGHGADALPRPWPSSAERELAQVLVRVRSFTDPHRRERVLRDTGEDIAFHVQSTGSLINTAREVIGLCLEYEDGIDRFAAALRWYESHSLPMRKFDRTVIRLRAQREEDGGR